MCPITQQAKGYPFEVPLPEGSPVRGVVLSDHIKSLDLIARRSTTVGKAPDSLTHAVLANVLSVLGLRFPES